MSAHFPANAPRHLWYEDVQAIAIGTLLVALGMVMFKQIGLLTGGTAGISFLLHYAFGWNFGLLFFLVNLPFYGLAWRELGIEFTLKTFVSVGLLALEIELLPRVLAFSHLDPVFAAVMGGFLIGVGLLVMFRHRASLGGINILVVWLQHTRGWRAGVLQMGTDALILTAGIAVTSLPLALLSLLGAVALNLVVAVNHRPGRYLGV